MRQLTLSDGRIITLNTEQNAAMDLLQEWVAAPDLFFRLSGYAGTGKTTLTKELINYLTGTGYLTSKNKIAVTAPTHKAKRVISEATGLEGFTIQKLLGLGLDTDTSSFDPSKPEFKQKYTPLLPDYKFVVMDEGSMINSELVTYILSMASRNNVKVLFMADKAQLPPVNEMISRIFTCPEITYHFQLTMVERQSGDNPLMKIYDSIRSDLRCTNDTFKHETVLNEKGEGIDFQQLSVFQDGAALAYVSPEFEADPSHVKVLAWTNEEVGKWNRTIRKHRMDTLHPGKPIGAIAPGDLLMAYASREDCIVNSSEYLIISAELKFKNLQYPKGNGTASTQIAYISAMAKDIDTGEILELPIVNPYDKVALATWNEMYWAFISKAKKQPKCWQDYFCFRGKLLLIQDHVVGYSTVKKDIDFAYAVTVHKSQGSTYNEVFVVEPDINKNRKTTERNQLKYVALSRPRRKATILSR